MMFKKINLNPALLFLLVGNLYCIWYYQKYPGGFATVVWIYWFQSVIIGLFNFLQLLTFTNKMPGAVSIENTQGTVTRNGCQAWFFLVHYGGFHLAYFFILLFKFDVFSVKKIVLLIGIAVFLLESLLNFISVKRDEKTVEVNMGILFFSSSFSSGVTTALVGVVFAFVGGFLVHLVEGRDGGEADDEEDDDDEDGGHG